MRIFPFLVMSIHHIRKHRAPKSALRLHSDHIARTVKIRQKAPSAKRCIKTLWTRQDGSAHDLSSQKAPSAKRCIKTRPRVRDAGDRDGVRKHRAPNGALRLDRGGSNALELVGQKAPSAKRCIKTVPDDGSQVQSPTSSESTERQTVH